MHGQRLDEPLVCGDVKLVGASQGAGVGSINPNTQCSISGCEQKKKNQAGQVEDQRHWKDQT